MNSSAILVLGATGPAGICVLREALYRQRPTIAYVRNASKIPDDLRRDSLLEVRS
jgi:putative NADH-flavin reductase